MSMSAVELFFHGLMCAMRPLGLLIMLPLGWDLLSVSMRISIAVAFAVFLAPHIAPLTQFTWIDIILELLLGAILGLPAALLIECSAHIGELFDILRGQSIASVYEPLQQQVSPLSATMAKWVVWTLILAQGTAVEIAKALLQSVTVIRPGVMVLSGVGGVGWKVLLFVPKMLLLTMTACLPYACSCIAVEIILVCISKQMPSLGLTTEGFLLKYGVAVGAVVLTAQPETAQLLSTLAGPLIDLVAP